MKNQRKYKGFITEHLDFFTDTNSFAQLIYYLPFSRYLKPKDTDNEEINMLWNKKYKLELYLAVLFIIGLIAIPLFQYIVYPIVMQE